MHSSRVRLSKLECSLITEECFLLTTFQLTVSCTWCTESIPQAFPGVTFGKTIEESNPTLVSKLICCALTNSTTCPVVTESRRIAFMKPSTPTA